MLADIFDSFAQIFSPPFRRVMWKSLGLTTALLVLAGFGLDRLALSLIHVGPLWLSAILSVVVALGVIAGMVFLAAPTVSLVASFYLDDIASIVERAKAIAIKRAIATQQPEGIRETDLQLAFNAEYVENDIFPSSDVTEDWLKLIDYEPENVVKIAPVRPLGPNARPSSRSGVI